MRRQLAVEERTATTPATRVTVLHFAESDDTSGFFPQLAKFHDRKRYRMLFGTLKPMASWLRDFMEQHGVACFSCETEARIAYPLAVARLATHLRHERVGVLHTHLFEPSVVGLLAGVLARTPVRVLTRHHSDYHTRMARRVHVALDRLCNYLSHTIIAVSRHTGEHIVREEGTAASKVNVIVNGIDFARVRVTDGEAVRRIRLEWGVGDGHLLVVPARLHPEKGHTYLFRALGEIRRGVTRPVVVLIAGAGPFEAAYRAEVRALGCDAIVHFVGFRRDVADLMTAADLVVVPSTAEAFGLVVAEALYLGTAIVATRVGGIPEIVDDGIDGVLVPPADSKALAEAVVALLNDDARRLRLSGVGREKVGARFGFEEMTRAYEGLYEQLLGRPCPPSP